MGSDIAVVGMGCRFPGARNPREFWRNLADGVESVRSFTDEELRQAGVPPRLLRDPRYVRRGVVLQDVAMFDAEFFGFSPKEAAVMDPQHRHFLECAWEAMEDAGNVPEGFRGSIGVFAGSGMAAYFAHNVLHNRELMEGVGFFLLRHTGNDKDFLTTRASYCFDLKGPSVAVQTACSTSLVAVHQACQSLLAAECDMALAGGVTIEVPHGRGYLYAEGEVLSPDGHCRAFDHRSGGTVFGSGVGVVVLKRLEDAIRDRDHVRAVIKATAINNDGSNKVGYLAPSVDGQAEAMSIAIDMAGVEPSAIGYVECHGSGTAMGDPIEVAALSQAFGAEPRRQGCLIGSVKTNIGHLDTAAGVAALIKVVLALEHGAIPPSLNYEAANPQIDFAKSPFRVAVGVEPWQRGSRPRIAGVNSLGVGGTNAFAVLQEAPLGAMRPAPAPGPHLLVVSARNGTSLDGACTRLAAFLEQEHGVAMQDVAFTLGAGRKAFERRRVVVAADREEAVRLLRGELPQRVHSHHAVAGARVVFLLPGGGAQYRHMARGLYRDHATFRQHVDRGLELLRGQLDVDLREAWLGDTMDPAEVDRALDRPSVQLPAIFLVEYALAQLWMERGIRPAALLGHSLGENTAACLAGVFRFEDALRLVTLRGRLFERVPRGGMLSVSMQAEELAPLLGDDLDLAVVNAPGLCVASGTDAALDRLAQELDRRGIEWQRVRIAIAAHSRLLEPILAEFEAFLRSIPLAAPTIPVVSNRSGRELTAAEARDPAYWVAHLRNTVRFADCMGTLLEDARNVFLEVGPGRTLSSLARLHPSWRGDRSAIASLRHPEEPADDAAFLLAAHGRLWAAGAGVDIARLVDRPGSRRIPLPTYAFRHQAYWVEPDRPAAGAAAQLELRRNDDIAQWGHVPRFVPVEAPAGRPDPGPWLLFLDAAGCLAELAARLRAGGAQVVEVRLGDAFVARGPGDYLLGPELGEEGYLALFRDLAARGQLPTAIVHGWLLTPDRGFRPGSSWFHRCQEQGFHSLLFLLRAMAAEEVQGARLTVVANGIGGPDGDADLDVEKATALGPALVAPREFAQLHCAVVDVAMPKRRRGDAWRAHWRAVAAALEPAATGLASGRHALRGEAWFRAVHRPAPALAVAQQRPAMLRERGTYLITGGFGGIGSVLGEWLARTCRARLVLQSRTQLPAPGAWDEWLAQHGPDHRVSRAIRQVRRLESLGAEVLPLAADVANVVDMRRGMEVLAARFGPLHGVFHAAGVVEDGLIASKDPDEMERVLAPKVQGALVLDQLLGRQALDFMLLFSSSSSVLGPAGQADYVAANAFLNALARRESALGRPVAAIQWGTWQGIGMTQAMLAAGSGAGRSVPIGVSVFRELVQAGSDQWIVLGSLEARATWMLDEHRTTEGDAILPGTAYLELIGQAVRAIGENGAFELRDVFFFRPLHVPDEAVRRIRCRLRRTPEGFEAVVQSHCELPAGGAGWQTHAQARVLLHALPEVSARDLAAAAASCPRAESAGDADALRTGQFRHLAFGPRWQVLREVRYGSDTAMARLALPRQYAAEVPATILHPALMDLATGFAMELIEDYVPERMWVPVSYGSVRVHAPLGDTLVSLVQRCEVRGAARDLATFDLVVCDASGQVLVEVEGFSIHRLAAGAQLGAAPQPQAADLEVESAAGGASPAERALAEAVSLGIRPEEGAAALARVLSAPLVPELLLSPVPVEQLLHAVDAAGTAAPASGTRFARPTLDSEFVAPRDEVERTLVQFWQELLGVAQVGVRDNFFDLGGHSLIAVRLFARIRKTFQVDYPISVLFDAPTVEACAELLRRDGAAAAGGTAPAERSEAPRNRYRHLVPMRTSPKGGTPFFLVAGMFGNVLNLRHLAHLLGEDRSFYGLQARGLYGDTEPHPTFEAAATDYIAELRTVQPSGPYLLGGFSGGGLTAFEMARQLRALGEQVGLLVLLDTPLPKRPQLTAADRVRMQLQNLRNQGLGYFGSWLRSRVRWEWGKVSRRMGWTVDADDADRFQSVAIGNAFRAALGRYEMVHEPVDALLFRPVLDRHYRLGGGRFASRVREIVAPDNYWTPLVRSLQVVEVPGDHDSMVLEPNVRALAQELRLQLQRFDAARGAGS